MGFLDWFKQKPKRLAVREQRIWLNKRAKLAGIAAEVEQGLAHSGETTDFFLVAHFQDCLDELRSVVDERQFDRRFLFVVPVDGLYGRPTGVTFDASYSVRLIVAERHPLLSHDQAVLEFARDLPCRCDVVHHVSLDDAVAQIFSGEWVQGILEKLGMDENHPIESRMVVRRLEQALLGVKRSSTGDLPAESAERWFEYNCRELWPKLGG